MKKNLCLLASATSLLLALSACDKKHDAPQHGGTSSHTPAMNPSAMPMQETPSEMRMLGDMKIEVQGAWARATVEGQHMGGAFVNLTADQDATLVGASSSVSDKVELHTMKMEGEKMIMAQVPNIALPANTKVELKPGSLHIMFMGLEIKNKAGKSEFLEVQAPVKAVAAPMKP